MISVKPNLVRRNSLSAELLSEAVFKYLKGKTVINNVFFFNDKHRYSR